MGLLSLLKNGTDNTHSAYLAGSWSGGKVTCQIQCTYKTVQYSYSTSTLPGVIMPGSCFAWNKDTDVLSLLSVFYKGLQPSSAAIEQLNPHEDDLSKSPTVWQILWRYMVLVFKELLVELRKEEIPMWKVDGTQNRGDIFACYINLLLLFSRSVVSNSLQLHGLQHTRPPCPSLSPRVCSNSCSLSWWSHPLLSPSPDLNLSQHLSGA